jgi:hypothetical protein
LPFDFFIDGGEEDDSDTEFEDDMESLPMPLQDDLILSYHSIEEKRAHLEKVLGAKKFIEFFPSIQVTLE